MRPALPVRLFGTAPVPPRFIAVILSLWLSASAARAPPILYVPANFPLRTQGEWSHNTSPAQPGAEGGIPMDVAKSFILRTAAVTLTFVIVLAVAPETRAQVSISMSNPSDLKRAEGLVKYLAVYNQLLSGPFHPNSGQMISGLCGTGPVPIVVTNGSVPPLRYPQNTGGCSATLQCYSGGCTGTATGPVLTLLPKPSPPFRAFGFSCPPGADTICLTPGASGGNGEWRLQAVYP
jgi:hypothetical protein